MLADHGHFFNIENICSEDNLTVISRFGRDDGGVTDKKATRPVNGVQD